MSFQRRFGILIAALALAGLGLPLAAQAPASGLCGPLSSFLIEHPQNLSDIQSTQTSQLNPALLAGYFAGTQQIRSRIAYSATTQILTVDLFLANVGAPIPSPPQNFSLIDIGFIVVNIDHVYATCAPFPSFLLTGIITNGAPLYFPPAGDPFGLSFAYNIPGGGNGLTQSFGPGTTVRDIITDSAGLAMQYHSTINATVTLAGAAPLAPLIKVVLPGGAAPGTTPVAVSTSPFQLDASGTVDPNQGILSYTWVTDRPAAFWPSNKSPLPQITFQNGAGNYKVTLYVTSNAGMSATTNFVIAYSGATN